VCARGTLADLATGRHGGRDALPADAITVLKSVGTAASDLAAATLVYEHAARDA
jgi:ornithine cyclodeaminase/alanine dehydrogenase-like protein (mu-crystallin family)